MRLTHEQIAIIRRTAQEIFGPEARVWLFGSRVDDSKRGGDVDLLVESGRPIDAPAFSATRLSASCLSRGIDILLATIYH